jgi:hypothetical protein
VISPLRVLVFVAVCATGFAVVLSRTYSSEEAQWVLIRLLQFIGPLLLAFSAEIDERQPSSIPRRTPAWPFTALVPGHGRGLAFSFLTLLAVLASFLTYRAMHEPGAQAFGDDDPTQLATICLFAWCYCMAMALAARAWPIGLVRIIRCSLLTVGTSVALFLLSLLLSFGGAVGANQLLLSLAFPPRLLEAVKQDGHWSQSGWAAFLVLCAIAGVLAAANARRFVQGITELMSLRRTTRINGA